MVMETPDEMLARLDRMGEERVRALLGKGDYFEPKTVSLVRGWIERKERKRESNGDRDALPNLQAALDKVRADAHRAAKAAEKAQRFAMIAIGVGAASALVAVLALFALAIR